MVCSELRSKELGKAEQGLGYLTHQHLAYYPDGALLCASID